MIGLLKNAPRLGDIDYGRDNNFNLIRMLAAFGVLVSHAYPLSLGLDAPEPFETYFKGDNLGRISVFAFFVVSGYFITKSFETRHSIYDFYAARALRLFPALIATVLLVFCTFGWFVPVVEGFWAKVPKHTLWYISLQGLVLTGGPQKAAMFTTNPLPNDAFGSLWTLRYEALCYIGVAVAGSLGIFKRKILFLACAIAFLALDYFVPQVTGRPIIVITFYLGVPFVVGASFYVFRHKIPMSLWIALALAACVPILRPTPLFMPMFIVAMSYTLLLFGYANTPRLRAYNRLGDYSYGFYLYAFAFQQLATYLGFATPLSNMLVAAPLTLVMAVLSWHLLEKPMLALKRKTK